MRLFLICLNNSISLRSCCLFINNEQITEHSMEKNRILKKKTIFPFFHSLLVTLFLIILSNAKVCILFHYSYFIDQVVHVNNEFGYYSVGSGGRSRSYSTGARPQARSFFILKRSSFYRSSRNTARSYSSGSKTQARPYFHFHY